MGRDGKRHRKRHGKSGNDNLLHHQGSSPFLTSPVGSASSSYLLKYCIFPPALRLVPRFQPPFFQLSISEGYEQQTPPSTVSVCYRKQRARPCSPLPSLLQLLRSFWYPWTPWLDGYTTRCRRLAPSKLRTMPNHRAVSPMSLSMYLQSY